MKSEKYEQGREDALIGEFNSFFYDLYFDYRQGYDEASGRGKKSGYRRLLLALVAAGLLIGVVAGGVFWLGGRPPSPNAASLSEATSVPPTRAPTRSPTKSSASPTRTAEPSKQRSALVKTGGSRLRMRGSPTLGSDVVGTLNDGSEATIIAGPVEADGHTWWQIERGDQRGWASAKFLELKDQ